MSSSNGPGSHAHSTSVSTNLSQASTKILGGEAPRTPSPEKSNGSSEKNDIADTILKGDTASAQFEQEKPSMKRSSYQIFDADGLEYSKPGPAFTETTDVPKENLGFIQVVALMINQSVGSGIFFAPGYTLLLTKSKSTSVALWIAGGVYSLLSAFVFLEFSTALPYNGGALIYLDEAFPRPRMLATTIFSFFWILMCSNSANCVAGAIYILELVYPTKNYGDVDARSAQFLAIIVNSLACLLLYFTLRGCLLLNSIFAAFKLALLTIFFVAGIAHACKSGYGLADFNEVHSGGNAVDSIAAMTYVVSTYEGWENTNYISGEIRASRKTLKWATFTALTALTVLYVLVIVAYYAVLPYKEIEASAADISVQFAEAIFGDGTATKVSVMLSTVTCVIFSTYTVAKVKQAIAWQRIIPFYKFVGRQDRQFDSPGGALVLHWIFTTIRLAAQSPSGDSWDFATGIYTYGYEIMLVFMGIGIFLLPRRMKILEPEWKPMYMKGTVTKIVLVFVFVGMSLLMLYSWAEPEALGTVPRYYWPITLGCIIGGAILYWSVLKALQMKWGSGETLGLRLGFEVFVHETGDEIPDELNIMMAEALADGSRRRLTYKVSGDLAKMVNWTKIAWKIVLKYLG